MAAIVESRVYCALARELGITVREREDGRGHEIEGIAQQTLDAYSTRAHAVTRTAAALALQWAQKYGRGPVGKKGHNVTNTWSNSMNCRASRHHNEGLGL